MFDGTQQFRNIRSVNILILLVALHDPALGETPNADSESVLLRDGLYRVEVTLELPHLLDAAARRLATICVMPSVEGGARGLTVLSQNNPLGSCPASNVSQDNKRLQFDIACEGKNAAKGRAVYLLSTENFEGRIEMKMGGKNMTMTETQRGRRIGPCAPRSESQEVVPDGLPGDLGIFR